MAITIPDRTAVRLTTDFDHPQNGHALPSMRAAMAMVNPTAIAADSGGPDSNGQAQVTQAIGTAGRAIYLGYSPDFNIAVGDPVSPCRQVIVEGFAGCTPGAAVYLASTGADVSDTTSGLTHTPTTVSGTVTSGAGGETVTVPAQPVGVALSATRILFH